jgi:predicted glycosyltransferase
MNVPRFDDARVLMYSHDTFGLGHLRRCREIAHALVEAYRGVSVLIISGSTIAGAFDYRVRVDFVKIPSVIKLHNGEYQSMAEHISLADTLQMRREIILQTAKTYRPDIFITDKEPLGLQGEVEDTLAWLKSRGCQLVLGLREVMDAPELLGPEWASHDVLSKIARYYDAIWAYGPEGFHDPLCGLDVPAEIRAKMRYTGFLRRRQQRADPVQPRPKIPYSLITTGGGGDGTGLIRAVLAAHRHDRTLPHAVLVLGPYVLARNRSTFLAEAADLPTIDLIDFDNRMEDLIAEASCLVAMGGYNTFCEILSFDKPALIVPRSRPRLEQTIRARRGTELGMITMMTADEAADPQRMAPALRALPGAPRPSQSTRPEYAPMLALDGLSNITADLGHWLSARQAPRKQVSS